jgi:hypothetical protein
MKKFVILTLLLFFFSLSACAEKPDYQWGFSGGLNAGMIGIGANVTVRLLMIQNSFLRLGAQVTDSYNLYPVKDWRRFAPVTLDYIYYFYDEVYVGGGLNVPVKVSDQKTAAPGKQFFMGIESEVFDYRIFFEAGYSELNIKDAHSFNGTYLMLGYRYSHESRKAKRPLPPVPGAEIPSEVRYERAPSDAALNSMREEYDLIKNYIKELDTNIAVARKDRDYLKVTELRSIKNRAIQRAKELKQKIREEEGWIELYEVQ